MTLQGKVINGAVVLDQLLAVADGTPVEVIVREKANLEGESEPTLSWLLEFAGCIPDLPPDFAEQHDHYIHGTPKR